MEKAIIKAEVRTGTGKTVAKDLRNKGIVPGNVYKSGKEAISIQMPVKELEHALHTDAGENVLVILKITGGTKAIDDKTVVIKEIQREPIKFGILHVDFGEISLTEELKVDVPLIAHGEPVGVTADGGILEHIMHEVHVECLPADIPEKIEVDVSNLKLGESILVKDIPAPQGVKIMNDLELMVMIVKTPKVEAPVVEEVVEESTEPELIRKKKEEEGVEGEAPKEAAKPEAKKE